MGGLVLAMVMSCGEATPILMMPLIRSSMNTNQPLYFIWFRSENTGGWARSGNSGIRWEGYTDLNQAYQDMVRCCNVCVGLEYRITEGMQAPT